MAAGRPPARPTTVDGPGRLRRTTGNHLANKDDMHTESHANAPVGRAGRPADAPDAASANPRPRRPAAP